MSDDMDKNNYECLEVIMDMETMDIIMPGDLVRVKRYVPAPIPELKEVEGRIVSIHSSMRDPSRANNSYAGLYLDCSTKYKSSICKFMLKDINSIEKIKEVEE